MLAYTFYESDNRVMRYAETLCKRGDEVDVFVLRKSGQERRANLRGVNVYRIQKRTRNEKLKLTYLFKLIIFLLYSSLFLIKKHLARRYDLIHVHSVPDFEVFAAWLPKLTGAKIILDIHDIVPELYAAKFRSSHNAVIFKLLVWLEKVCIAFSHHVLIANHLWHKRLISRSATADKCTVIMNYPDPAIMHRRPRQRHDGRFILAYPGTLNWHQGVDVAIKALALIKDKIPNMEFHIYGEGRNKNDLMLLVAELGLENIVRFKGVFPLEKSARAMAEVDVGIEPKRKDSFGNEAFSTKILEFISLGVPVIASDTDIHKFYLSGSVVKFFQSGNASDLAQCILLLKENNSLRNSLVQDAFKFIEKTNWEVKKGEYLQLVDTLVMNHRTVV
jgi:glycosyltransferase involved in cell wall biosynthesis